MGTVIDRIAIADGGWRSRHSALRLAVKAAKAASTTQGGRPTTWTS